VKEGQGKLFDKSDGSLYEGNFKNDLKDGNGTLKLKDGTIIDTTWVKGQKHGKGVIKPPNKNTLLPIEYSHDVEIS